MKMPPLKGEVAESLAAKPEGHASKKHKITSKRKKSQTSHDKGRTASLV